MRATPGSWKSEPLPANRARLKLEHAFSAAEWDALQQGVIPEEMEDKWFIYEERGWLYFHRSWTGFCVFQVQLKKSPTGGEIAEAWVNRNKEQYTCVDDAYDAQLLSWLIDVLLLKRPALFPDSDQLDGMEPLRQWSSVGRAMLAHDNDGRAAAGLDRALREAPEVPLKDLQSPAGRTVRRVLDVSGGAVQFCGWDGAEPHHVHAVHKLAPGAVVSVGDDVPPRALGVYVGHHWYRRVGEKCLLARGDGTLYEERVKAN